MSGRASCLPRSGDEIDPTDAAALLLAVMGAPRPEDAAEVVTRLAGLPLLYVNRKIGDATWAPGTDEDYVVMFGDMLDRLASDFESDAEDGQFALDRIWVEEGGASAELSGWLSIDGDSREYRAGYGQIVADVTPSLRRFAEYRTDARKVIAEALSPPIDQAAGHDEPLPTMH